MSDHLTINIDHTRNKRDVYEKIAEDKTCPFCVDFKERKETLTYHQKPVLIDGKYWAVTENFDPYKGTSYHFLIIHREHITSMSEVSREASTELIELIRQLEETYSLPAAVFLMRFGDTRYTGASVAHLHAQLVLGDKKEETSEPLLLYAGYKKL